MRHRSSRSTRDHLTAPVRRVPSRVAANAASAAAMLVIVIGGLAIGTDAAVDSPQELATTLESAIGDPLRAIRVEALRAGELPILPATDAAGPKTRAARDRLVARRRTKSLETPTTLVGVLADPVRSDELQEAVAVADRLLANIETVVSKRDEIRLVITALACGGHVLFEDVPGTAKTVLARRLPVHRGRRRHEDPVHARPPAHRRHRARGLRPAHA